MNYSDFTNALVILFEDNDAFGIYTFASSPDFSTYLPRIIEQAELRCYREICPLAARSAPSNGAVTAGQRSLNIGLFNPLPIVVEGLALITPQGSLPAAGRRYQYRKVSLDFIDTIWPVEATVGAPGAYDPELYFAYKDASTLVLAPTPDANYVAELTGTVIPTPISMANPSTYLSTTYPDAFLFAAAVATAGLHRDYGVQSDDPKMALTWEERYQVHRAEGVEEERRRRGTNVALSEPASAVMPSAPRGP